MYLKSGEVRYLTLNGDSIKEAATEVRGRYPIYYKKLGHKGFRIEEVG